VPGTVFELLHDGCLYGDLWRDDRRDVEHSHMPLRMGRIICLVHRGVNSVCLRMSCQIGLSTAGLPECEMRLTKRGGKLDFSLWILKAMRPIRQTATNSAQIRTLPNLEVTCHSHRPCNTLLGRPGGALGLTFNFQAALQRIHCFCGQHTGGRTQPIYQGRAAH
jgi:hypothetical protein